MKNSVKFFVGGIIAATLILGAFAFTTKQKENKEYLVVRIVETFKQSNVKDPMIQISDKDGIIEIRKNTVGQGQVFRYGQRRKEYRNNC